MFSIFVFFILPVQKPFLICAQRHPKKKHAKPMHPDLIIVLEDGQVKSVVSNHHLTYAILDVRPSSIPELSETLTLSSNKESDLVGTPKQMLRYVGLPVPVTKEFDPTAVVTLASENKFLSSALGKYGFTLDPAIRALAAKPEQLNQALVKALRALYNAFIVTDPKLMGQYLDIQTR